MGTLQRITLAPASLEALGYNPREMQRFSIGFHDRKLMVENALNCLGSFWSFFVNFCIIWRCLGVLISISTFPFLTDFSTLLERIH